MAQASQEAQWAGRTLPQGLTRLCGIVLRLQVAPQNGRLPRPEEGRGRGIFLLNGCGRPRTIGPNLIHAPLVRDATRLSHPTNCLSDPTRQPQDGEVAHHRTNDDDARKDDVTDSPANAHEEQPREGTAHIAAVELDHGRVDDGLGMRLNQRHVDGEQAEDGQDDHAHADDGALGDRSPLLKEETERKDDERRREEDRRPTEAEPEEPRHRPRNDGTRGHHKRSDHGDGTHDECDADDIALDGPSNAPCGLSRRSGAFLVAHSPYLCRV